MPRETRYAAGDETYCGRRVGSGRHGKTEWGKGVPLTGATYGVRCVSEVGSLGGPFPTVRATAVGRDVEWNAVLAGDPKLFRLLCILI